MNPGLPLKESSPYRIVVRLNNSCLEQVGPLVTGNWRRHDDALGREAQGQFLLDTGAYGAMIDLKVAENLQLPSQGVREVHGIHGYGQLPQFLGQVSLPAQDRNGNRALYTAMLECVGVPSLCDRNRQQGVEVIGILGRIFLRGSRLTIDGVSGIVELELGAGPASVVS